MAVHASHGALPYPIKGARYSLLLEHRASTTNIPTDPGTPDTEVSKDGGDFADAAEEASVITGSVGVSLLTLTGAETNCSLLALASKAGSGATTTLERLKPRVLPVLHAGTAQAGAAGGITLAADAPAFDLAGCIVKTTAGTGGGGTGGANNQARMITAYNAVTKEVTVAPNWETATDADTEYEVLLTELCVNAAKGAFLMPADMAQPYLDNTALLASLNDNVLTAGMLARAR